MIRFVSFFGIGFWTSNQNSVHFLCFSNFGSDFQTIAYKTTFEELEGWNGNKIGFIDKSSIKRVNKVKRTFRLTYTRSKFRMQKREKIQIFLLTVVKVTGRMSTFESTESSFLTFVPIKRLTSVTWWNSATAPASGLLHFEPAILEFSKYSGWLFMRDDCGWVQRFSCRFVFKIPLESLMLYTDIQRKVQSVISVNGLFWADANA